MTQELDLKALKAALAEAIAPLMEEAKGRSAAVAEHLVRFSADLAEDAVAVAKMRAEGSAASATMIDLAERSIQARAEALLAIPGLELADLAKRRFFEGLRIAKDLAVSAVGIGIRVALKLP